MLNSVNESTEPVWIYENKLDALIKTQTSRISKVRSVLRTFISQFFTVINEVTSMECILTVFNFSLWIIAITFTINHSKGI